MTHAGVVVCAADRLASFLPDYPGAMPRPDWQSKRHWQRDFAAESMGY